MPPEESVQQPVAPNNSPFGQPINPDAQRLAAQPPKEPARSEPQSAPGSKAWHELSPDQRAAHNRAITDAGRTSDSVHTRDPRGNLLIDGKRADGSTPDQSQTQPVDQPAPAPGEKVKIGDVEMTAEEWAAAASHKAESDLRSTQIPASAADYKLELPADLRLPEGIAVSLADRKDPMKGAAMVAATEWAAANRLSQDQFSQMLGLYAAASANETAMFESMKRAEFEGLGTAGPVRVDAVTRWLAANYGAAAKPMIATLTTKAQVEVWESVITKMANQGRSSGFNRLGDQAEERGVSEETYNSWSYSQKKEYAERMSGGGPRSRR